jgi:hypothetical protein
MTLFLAQRPNMLSFFFFITMPAGSPSAAQQIDTYQKTVLTQPMVLLLAGERQRRPGPPPQWASGGGALYLLLRG